MTILLAILSAVLFGVMAGAWLALEWMRRLRPGRESDLLAELAALRANTGLHHAALNVQEQLWQVVQGGWPAQGQTTTSAEDRP